MREIKFRAWDISKRKILRNVGFHPHICMIHEGYKIGGDGELTIAPDFTNYKIMQYTGLKDKNGVEIYEGDIVRVGDKGEVTEVTFFEGCFYTVTGGGNYRCGGWNRSSIEVIGNIHQHSNLLSGEA